MDTLPDDVIGRVGRFLDQSSRKVCLETAHSFHAINYEYAFHNIEINNDNVQDKLCNIGKILKYIKCIKPSCKAVYIHFKNLTDPDFIDVAYLENLCTFLDKAFESIRIHLELCDYNCIMKLLNGLRTWQCAKLHILQLQQATENLDVACLKNAICALKNPACATLMIHENNLHLLKDMEIMSLVQSLYVYINYNLGIQVSPAPISVSLKNLNKLEKVALYIGESNVTIEDGADSITHLYLKGMIWKTGASSLLISLSQVNKTNSRMVEFSMSEAENEDTKVSHTWLNGWYNFAKIAPPKCKIIYSPTPQNIIAFNILKKLVEENNVSIVYGYSCDDTYLLSKVFAKLLPRIIVEASNGYKPPAHLSMLTQFDVIHSHLTEFYQPLWHWIKYMPNM